MVLAALAATAIPAPTAASSAAPPPPRIGTAQASGPAPASEAPATPFAPPPGPPSASPSASPPASPPASPAPAPSDPVEASEAADDPLEHLRRRLAERLAAKPLTPAAGPYDLRVSARAAPGGSAAGGASRSPARPASGPRLPAWDYGGAGGAGPEAWGGLCTSGQRQSPIDLQGGLPVPLAPIRFDYGAAAFSVLDTGRAVQVEIHGQPPGPASIEVAGTRYWLQQLSVHRPSEVQIDGRRFALSLQLTHRAADGALAVVVLVLDPGPAQPALDAVLAHLPLEQLQRNRARSTLDLATLLPADPRYFMYTGSLTTPPCTEDVLRLVMRHPLTASPAQIEVLSRLYAANVRPLQAAAGRRILQSD
jgi:carbonic anhydrase